MAGFALLLALPVAAQQQDNTAPPPPGQSTSAAQKKDAQQKNQQQKKPSTAEQNPFPEAQSEQAAHQGQQQDQSAPAAQQDEPAAPQAAEKGAGKKPSAADQNPFPEAQSEKAAQKAGQQPSQPSASGNGQPDHDYSSSQDQLKGLDLTGASDSHTTDGAGGTILSPELGRKDTKVGEFYLHTGDYKGAYNRFVEATRVDPCNAQAVFDLAEAARHLNHRDEAVRNYRLYLSALPDGPRAKDARKALKDLGAPPNS